MQSWPAKRKLRRAAIAPLTAVLLIPLLAMVAFAVDLGYLVLVKTELQHTADAAALAGAQQLMTPYTLWVVPSARKFAIRAEAIAAAREAAKTYASYNQAGQVSITLLDDDIEVGFLDAQGTFNPTPAPTQFPNSVRVLARRDAKQNSPVSLFFARVIGTSSQELTAAARSTIYTATLNSLKSPPAVNARVLPITYDVNDWDNFLKTGIDADGITSVDASGNPKLQVYPSIKDKGNFAELALDDEHTGSSEIRDWVANGLNAGTSQVLAGRGLIPLTSHDATLWDWLGNPGFKSSVVQEINSHIGEEFILPLSTPRNNSEANYELGVGEGSHFYFNVVRFVSIKVVSTSNRNVIIQPSGYVDPAAVFDLQTVKPAGTQTGPTIVTTLTSPKLNQ